MCGLHAYFFFFQAEDGIRYDLVTGVQTCALPILRGEAVGTLSVQYSLIVAAEESACAFLNAQGADGFAAHFDLREHAVKWPGVHAAVTTITAVAALAINRGQIHEIVLEAQVDRIFLRDVFCLPGACQLVACG